MLEELKRLLTPNVSLAAKLIGVSMYFIKLLQRHDERIGTLEERQLQKGDKGEKGEKGVRVHVPYRQESTDRLEARIRPCLTDPVPQSSCRPSKR